ncbi:MAG TPA: UPF0175 family protein [Nostoc sp.]|uniref:UPF0175 family protein n=1 Tax=Nostoc sp. TaxID=1180 RepID=UPI002D6CEBBC|nr:UPF0175 family protein [Nostoc sp.]HYX18335.1 UPF0175 family protein [Nostoc sp.]
MNLHLTTAKYDNVLSYKTYIHPGQGTPGEGYTPFEAIQDWVARTTTTIELYEKKQISLCHFAELLGISVEEAKQFLRAENIPLDLGINTVEELEQDIENA